MAQDHVHGEAGVVSSSKQPTKERLCSQTSSPKIVAESTLKNKMKRGGKLKHPAHNLKKIARLPDNDCKQVLKILMKKVHRRRGVKNQKLCQMLFLKDHLYQIPLLQRLLITIGIIG